MRSFLNLFCLDQSTNSIPRKVVDPWDHIIQTSFDPDTCHKSVSSSQHSKIAYQKRVVERNNFMMSTHNRKIVKGHLEAVDMCRKKGIFCCDNMDRTGLRCMCAFSTETGLRNHKNKDNHQYPTLDLKSWVTELHTRGRFAFCLATGKY